MKEIPLTREGFEKLKDELEFLRTKKRAEISDKIKVARSFGDLSENSEYEEAKNEQAIVEARIVEIENMLKNVVIIDEQDKNSDVVQIGSTVKVENLNNSKVRDYTIVGSSESDPKDGRISNESPVGKGLLGHRAGEKVDIHAPNGGVLVYKILEIVKS